MLSLGAVASSYVRTPPRTASRFSTTEVASQELTWLELENIAVIGSGFDSGHSLAGVTASHDRIDQLELHPPHVCVLVPSLPEDGSRIKYNSMLWMSFRRD